MEELSFAEILKNQKLSRKKPSKAQKAEKRVKSDDEAPEEISSKRPKKIKQIYERKERAIGPRFSDKFGKFNEEKFRANYEHAFALRDEELNELKKMKKADKDEKVNYLVQRMENQKREYAKKSKKIQSKQQQPRDTTYFPNKRKQRAEELLNKFKELKSAGKLDKYLDKKRKKESGKSRKKMNIEK